MRVLVEESVELASSNGSFDERRRVEDENRLAARAAAPIGSDTHPAIKLRDEFFRFLDDFQLPKEPGIEDALKTYLDQVEKAFQNVWPLHPNLISGRTDDQKIHQAYDLDFRENEVKRIRSILPTDKAVFDYMDAFVDVILLGNLKIFVKKRWACVRNLAISMIMGASIGVIVSFFMSGGFDTIKSAASFARAVGWATVGAAVGLAIGWVLFIKLKLDKLKQHYDDAARDAANLVALRLVAKGHDVENLMQSLKSRLETIASPDPNRVVMAPKLVRILLWCPERMGLIENYYRAKMDQFIMNSARVSLDWSAKRTGLIVNVAAGLVVIALVLAADASWARFAPVGGSPLDGIVDWLKGAEKASVRLLFASGALALLVLTAAGLGVGLARYSRRFEPVHVAQLSAGLANKLVASSSIALIVGVIIVALRHLDSVPHTLIAVVLVVAIAMWAARGALFWLILDVWDKEYTSNVLSLIERKMDAGQWTRYSDFRVDERVAEVFGAIYNAWYNESRKGILQSQPGTSAH